MAPNKQVKKYTDMIHGFSKQHIMVVGDIMMDEYIWGDANRISPEAPVPVVVVKERTYHPGGAANTVSNILSLGAKSSLLGISGKDSNGTLFRKVLKDAGIDISHIISTPSRPTTVKVRIIARGQQVMRADQEEVGPISDSILKKIIAHFDNLIDKVDGVAISDYDKGVITPKLMAHIINTSKEAGKIIAADIKPPNMFLFKGVTVITPNRMEASQMSGIKIRDEASLREAGLRLREIMGLKTVLITLGEGGMAIFNGDEEMEIIPAVSTQVYDVTGAGDTVLSTLVVAMSAGYCFKDSVALSNYAAGVVVRKRGTTSVDKEELIDFVTAVLT